MEYVPEEYIDIRFSKDMLAENKQKIKDLVKTASSRGDDGKLFIKSGDIEVLIKWKGSSEPTWEDLKKESRYYQNWILFNLAFTNIKKYNDSVQNSKGTLLFYVRTSNHKDESKDKFSLPDQIKYGIRCAKEYNYKVMMLCHNGVSGGYERIHDDKNHVIGYDYTQGHNTNRSDFQTFIGNLNYSTDEENNQEAIKDFEKYNVKALYCLRVDRLTRTSVMMRQLFQNLVVKKEIELLFGIKRKWNHRDSLLHPFLTSTKDEDDIMKEAYKAELFFVQKIRESSNKRKHDSITEELDKTEKELDELLSDLNVNSEEENSEEDSSEEDDSEEEDPEEEESEEEDSEEEDSEEKIEVQRFTKRSRRSSAPEITTKKAWYNIFTMTLSLLF